MTGENVGLGFRSVLELARKGARVVIACRSIDKGSDAADRILSQLPAARLDTLALDLTEAASIERFAGSVSGVAEAVRRPGGDGPVAGSATRPDRD